MTGLELQPELLTKLAKRLYNIRDTGRIIPFVEAGMKGDGSPGDDWRPAAKFCHANVEEWVMRSPEYGIVRGWVIFDLSADPSASRFRFAAHSVIRTPEGKLLDITPSAVSQPYPFIHHPGTTEDFDDLRKRYQVMFIDHYLDI
jgi:hypothetical protein